ncbi:MAG: macro domain-containing protein, partial [Bacteroidetes bacterium]|nr:macro domain-containing protein [Bacteroidota bacterium]
EECRPLAPIRPGEAVITGAHNLPNRHVIHCLGPVYGVDHPPETLLAACYDRALALAELHGIRSIAFPAISTGAFGYPMKDAAEIAFTRLLQAAPRLAKVQHIRVVLFSEEDRKLHEQALSQLLEKDDDA